MPAGPADGRVEAPEYSLLARFAETLKIGLPELRQRVNRRLQAPGNDRNTKQQTRREAPAPVKPAADPQPPAFESAQFQPQPAPMTPPPSSTAHHRDFPKETKVADLPPVTLQLLKQTIMFDTETDSLANIGRTLGIAPEAAAQIRNAIIAAFPDLKPASQVIRGLPRR